MEFKKYKPEPDGQRKVLLCGHPPEVHPPEAYFDIMLKFCKALFMVKPSADMHD